MTYYFDYVVGHTYKTKTVIADNLESAWKKSRLTKSVVDIRIKEYEVKDDYAIRDF